MLNHNTSPLSLSLPAVMPIFPSNLSQVFFQFIIYLFFLPSLRVNRSRSYNSAVVVEIAITMVEEMVVTLITQSKSLP